MGLEFLNPWHLLAAPVLLGWLWLIFLRRGGRSLKGKVSAALRSVSVVLLALAMAGAGLVMRGHDAQLIILADRSESAEPFWDDQEEWINSLSETLPDNYSMSVVSFGGDSRVEAGFEGEGFRGFHTQIDGGATDFEQSVRFASALFAGDAAKQVLLLTDGADNRGDAGRITTLLDAQGIRVDAHLFKRETGDDAQISRVDIPGTVYQNESFDIQVEVDSETEKRAVLLLYSGADLLSSHEVNLQKGVNSFVFRDTARNTGLVGYRAEIQETGGTVRNNRRSTVAKVLGAPRVLLIAGAEGEADEMRAMLAAASLTPETVPTQALPRTAAGLQQYDAVVFVNVNADDLEPEQVSALDHFVRTLGRGFVALGGDNSFALGSYIGSDLEKLLPVESDVRNKLDVPSLALVLAIDHSGSMSENAGGVSRLALARESAQRAVEQLTPKDSIGVIAFDDTAKWVAPLQSAENAEEVIGLIGGLRTGGGTMMYSSINEAYNALKGSDAAIKHLILLTDGQPADSGFEGIIAQMREEHITVSGVAMGADANDALLYRLSQLGGGRFYHVDAGDNIPSIFAKETQLSTQSYLQNRTFYPEYFMDSPLTEPFSEGLPALTGFLATVAKPTATVALRSDNDLPVLAHWQYGAGQAVAWTSDVNGGWSGEFLRWDEAAGFFGGFVSNVLSAGSGQGYLALRENGDTASLSLTVDGIDEAGTEATVIAPNGQEIKVSMRLTSPGEFSGEFPLEQEGVYAVRVDQSQNGQTVNSLEGGLPRGYSSEYDIREGRDLQSLTALLADDGAYVETPEQVFERPPRSVNRRYDLTAPLLGLGLLLFLLDIAARRLQWEARAEAAWRRFWGEKQDARPAGMPEDKTPGPAGPPQPTKDKSEKTAQPPPETGSELSAELLRRRGKK